jgi:hypothetical protein
MNDATKCAKCGSPTKFDYIIKHDVSIKDRFEDGAVFAYVTSRECTKCHKSFALHICHDLVVGMKGVIERFDKGLLSIQSGNPDSASEYIGEMP